MQIVLYLTGTTDCKNGSQHQNDRGMTLNNF